MTNGFETFTPLNQADWDRAAERWATLQGPPELLLDWLRRHGALNEKDQRHRG